MYRSNTKMNEYSQADFGKSLFIRIRIFLVCSLPAAFCLKINVGQSLYHQSEHIKKNRPELCNPIIILNIRSL